MLLLGNNEVSLLDIFVAAELAGEAQFTCSVDP